MEQAPRKILRTVVSPLLILALGLPGCAPVYPGLREEALRAQAAPQAAGLEQLDQALRSRRSAAGAEEVRKINAEEFFGEYHPALAALSPSRQEEIFQWMDYDGFEIREVALPDRVALYVRGEELKEELSVRVGSPPRVSFDWRMLPLSQGEEWERVGLILNDLGRRGPYDGENPNGLRVRDVATGEAAQLNAALLLAEALATLPPGSVLLGAEALPDTWGRVRLILFSA